MTRHLATVRTVRGLEPIPNADLIERAVIDGWNVVVKKGEFAVGESCLYFEIDSMLPVTDSRFAFLAARGVINDEMGEWHRLRTAKLRGVISQGLALPIAGFPETADTADLTAALGVRKFEQPLPGGNAIGPFPIEYASKTDAERVQNLVDEWDVLRQATWRATEKIDGTSCTVIWDVTEQRVRVCGRNWEIGVGDNMYWDAVRRYELEALAHTFATDYDASHSVALQCEIYGPGIQKNPLGVTDRRVALFTLWVDRTRTTLPDAHPLAAPTLDIPFPPTVEEAIAIADGMRSMINPERLAEGVVWHTPDHEPVKSINNRFLLKHDG